MILSMDFNEDIYIYMYVNVCVCMHTRKEKSKIKIKIATIVRVINPTRLSP